MKFKRIKVVRIKSETSRLKAKADWQQIITRFSFTPILNDKACLGVEALGDSAFLVLGETHSKRCTSEAYKVRQRCNSLRFFKLYTEHTPKCIQGAPRRNKTLIAWVGLELFYTLPIRLKKMIFFLLWVLVRVGSCINMT